MNTIKMESIAILGGGLSGVSLGAALSERHVNFRIFEGNDCVGGLARTLESKGFRWDLGVHALYSKDPQFLSKLGNLPIEYQHCRRNVKICHSVGDKVYPLDYPFENGLRDLPPEDLDACLDGYRKARANGSGCCDSYKHLADWIENGLGYGFSRIFMTPYNRKIWNAPLNRISMELVSKKIEPEPYEKILRYANGEISEGRGYQARFVYPKNGIQSLCDHFASVCGDRIFLKKRIVRVRKSKNGFALRFEDGEERSGFTQIVSTIPLKRFITCLPFEKLYGHTSRLQHNDTIFVMVGLKPGAAFNRFRNSHWSFYAGDEIFYRLTMMHTFSERFRHACVAEHTIHDTHAADLNRAAEKVVKDMLRRRILMSASDVETIRVHYEPFTYPIPTLGLDTTKRFIQSYLAGHRIHLLGRNGNWDYINMDQVLTNAENMAVKLSQCN